MKSIIRFLRSCGMKVKRLKEIFGISHSSCYEMPQEKNDDNNKETKDAALIERIKKLAYEFPFYGYRRCHIVLRKEGIIVNKKKVYRIYKLLNLERTHNNKKKTLTHSPTVPMSLPNGRDKIWSMDFIHDTLLTGRGIRILIIMNIFKRKIIRYRVDRSITTNDVTESLQAAIGEYGKSEIIRTGN